MNYAPLSAHCETRPKMLAPQGPPNSRFRAARLALARRGEPMSKHYTHPTDTPNLSSKKHYLPGMFNISQAPTLTTVKQNPAPQHILSTYPTHTQTPQTQHTHQGIGGA